MVQFQTPMFCSRCSFLALAELDGSHLCLSCLQSLLKTSEDPYLIYRIRPLELATSEIRGLVKTKPFGRREVTWNQEVVGGLG